MKVLYIGGTGRTGSTMLDRLLGSADGWFSGGELAFMWRYGLARNGLCSCGICLADCPVWSAALAMAADGGSIDPDRMVELRRRFWSAHLPFMVSGRVTRSRLAALEEFPYVVERTYRAAGEVTGARVLIDSSKDAHYSVVLRERTQLDLYFLHLVRDPRAIGYSWTKRRGEQGFENAEEMERRGVLKASVYFNVSNVASEWLWHGHHDRYRLLRYEDFVADPVSTVAQIADFVGEPIDLGESLLARTFNPGDTHITWGNPNRFDKGPARISSDDAWRRAQPKWRSRLLGAVNLPLARRYGYRWDIDRPPTTPRDASRTILPDRLRPERERQS